MKAVILSGGKGIHLPQAEDFITKALITINGLPLLYYILKHLYFYGISEVILCVDSNSEEPIKKVLQEKNQEPHLKNLLFKIKLELVKSGKNGKTGSMLFGLKEKLKEEFMLTYNDIITDVNISQLIQYHRTKGKILTIIGVHPTIIHGIIRHKEGIIMEYYLDKPIDTVIKGGYYILKPEIFEYLTEDCILENEPFQKIISERQAAVFDHKGFWQQFDSYKQIEQMENLFKEKDTSWMIK